MITKRRFCELSPYQLYELFHVEENLEWIRRIGDVHFFDSLVTDVYTRQRCFFCDAPLTKNSADMPSRWLLKGSCTRRPRPGILFHCRSCSWWGLSEGFYHLGLEYSDYFHMSVVAKFEVDDITSVILEVQKRLDSFADTLLFPDREKVIDTAVELFANYGKVRPIGRSEDGIVTLLSFHSRFPQIICLRWYPFGKVRLVAASTVIGFHFSDERCVGVTLSTRTNDIFPESCGSPSGVRIRLEEYDDLFASVTSCSQSVPAPWTKCLATERETHILCCTNLG